MTKINKQTGPGRPEKTGSDKKTVSITLRVPLRFKEKQKRLAAESGFDDLSSYILKVLSTYTVNVKLAKIERVILDL